jgi:hypothetical protein
MTFTQAEITAIIAGLDKPCWSCRDRSGRMRRIPEMTVDGQTCSICDHSGYTLTDSGRALVEWLRRHGKEQV